LVSAEKTPTSLEFSKAHRVAMVRIRSVVADACVDFGDETGIISSLFCLKALVCFGFMITLLL
jgi:hypothetical protein